VERRWSRDLDDIGLLARQHFTCVRVAGADAIRLATAGQAFRVHVDSGNELDDVREHLRCLRMSASDATGANNGRANALWRDGHDSSRKRFQ
jgi:hypothetical protein